MFFKSLLISFSLFFCSSGVLGSEGVTYPDVLITYSGDLSKVEGIREKVGRYFGSDEFCQSDVVKKNPDFELYIEGYLTNRSSLFLVYTVLQPFKKSTLFKIYNLPMDLGSNRKNRYAELSKIYVGGWVSKVKDYQDDEELAKRICLEYRDKMERPVAEAINDSSS